MFIRLLFHHPEQRSAAFGLFFRGTSRTGELSDATATLGWRGFGPRAVGGTEQSAGEGSPTTAWSYRVALGSPWDGGNRVAGRRLGRPPRGMLHGGADSHRNGWSSSSSSAPVGGMVAGHGAVLGQIVDCFVVDIVVVVFVSPLTNSSASVPYRSGDSGAPAVAAAAPVPRPLVQGLMGRKVHNATVLSRSVCVAVIPAQRGSERCLMPSTLLCRWKTAPATSC